MTTSHDDNEQDNGAAAGQLRGPQCHPTLPTSTPAASANAVGTPDSNDGSPPALGAANIACVPDTSTDEVEEMRGCLPVPPPWVD